MLRQISVFIFQLYFKTWINKFFIIGNLLKLPSQAIKVLKEKIFKPKNLKPGFSFQFFSNLKKLIIKLEKKKKRLLQLQLKFWQRSKDLKKRYFNQ